MSHQDIQTGYPSVRANFISSDQVSDTLDYARKIAVNRNSSSIGYVGGCVIAVADMVAAVVFDAPPIVDMALAVVAGLLLNEGLEGRRRAADLSEELDRYVNGAAPSNGPA